MCRFKSGILLKDRAYVPDHDHHTGMLEELGTPDTSRNPNFVRFEIIPPSGDPFTPVATWEFCVDQDFRPDWFVPEIDEKRARKAVEEWADKHIFIGIDGLELNSGGGYYLKDCTNVGLSGNATVRNMWGSSTVRNMWGSSTVQNMRGSSTVQDMWDSSTVRNMWGSSTVQNMRGSSTVQDMRDSSTVRNMWGSSTVQNMWDSSTVRNMWGSSTVRSSPFHDRVNPETLALCDNATFADLSTKTIYHGGDWELVALAQKED